MDTMTKAILINSTARTITEHTIDTWRDISPAIGCEMFTCVTLTKEGETAYVDDEGLLRRPKAFVKFASYHHPLAGNVLILGTDSMGESIDTSLSVEEVGRMVDFLNIDDIRKMVKEGAL